MIRTSEKSGQRLYGYYLYYFWNFSLSLTLKIKNVQKDKKKKKKTENLVPMPALLFSCCVTLGNQISPLSLIYKWVRNSTLPGWL